MAHAALRLYDYHVWANDKIFERLEELPSQIYDQEIPSVFPSIYETLRHIYMVDTLWLEVMKEQKMDFVFETMNAAKNVSYEVSLDEMKQLYAELSKKYTHFLWQQEDLDRSIVPEHPEYGKLETKLSELIHHVVNHGTYHRGNLTGMIRQLGHASIPTDYVMYLYEV